ncbi:MAG TPA: hypothetical protein VGB17_06730 [Pyrinomonadaceae bacterium]
MDLSESNLHSFIIKLWLEEANAEAERSAWGGHITHVPGGERRYIRDLDEIADFIRPYLESMGVEPGPRRQVYRWLTRLARRRHS